MNTSKAVLVLSLGCAFLAGCVASQVFVPAARAGTAPQRWEYFCFKAGDSEDITTKGNQAGKEGWEGSSLPTSFTPVVTAPVGGSFG